MRNDNQKWAPACGLNRPTVHGENVQLTLPTFSRQTLMSGPVLNGLTLAKQPKAHGWPSIARGEAYALRLRRDRILAINGPALNDGWHEGNGVAVSDMTSGFAALELSGPRAHEILNTGTELDLALPSGTAMRYFHRQEVILYRWQAEDSFRLHMPRGHLESLWQLLSALVSG